MAHHVTLLLADVETERKAINRHVGKQLQSSSKRSALRAIAERYFNEVRPQIVGNIDDASHVASLDSTMQKLVEKCHKAGAVATYSDLLKSAKTHLIQVDMRLVSTPLASTNTQHSDPDVKIIKTLRALLPSAALSYEQALSDLAIPDRLSWRGPATDLREALREALDHLAPDAEVVLSAGYKVEPNAHGPTMKQKVRFILKNRGLSKALSSPAESATESVDEALGTFVRSVYTRSNISTHTPTDRHEVLRVLDLVRVVLAELLEAR